MNVNSTPTNKFAVNLSVLILAILTKVHSLFLLQVYKFLEMFSKSSSNLTTECVVAVERFRGFFFPGKTRFSWCNFMSNIPDIKHKILPNTTQNVLTVNGRHFMQTTTIQSDIYKSWVMRWRKKIGISFHPLLLHTCTVAKVLKTFKFWIKRIV